MVFVPMREEDGVQLHYSFPEHLLAKVGTGIDHKAFAVHAQVDRTSKSFVPIIH
jgi:hypothetical protein